MCNRHHSIGCKGSKGHYGLTDQDLFEGFKVCGSLLSSQTAQAIPAQQHTGRGAREGLWEQHLLMHFHTQIKPNQVTEKFRTLRHSHLELTCQLLACVLYFKGNTSEKNDTVLSCFPIRALLHFHRELKIPAK